MQLVSQEENDSNLKMAQRTRGTRPAGQNTCMHLCKCTMSPPALNSGKRANILLCEIIVIWTWQWLKLAMDISWSEFTCNCEKELQHQARYKMMWINLLVSWLLWGYKDYSCTRIHPFQKVLCMGMTMVTSATTGPTEGDLVLRIIAWF